MLALKVSTPGQEVLRTSNFHRGSRKAIVIIIMMMIIIILII